MFIINFIMGTRGTIRIKIKNKIIYIYNQFDSYWEGLGRTLVEDLLELLEKYSLLELTDLFDKIELVSWNEKDARDKKRKEDFAKKHRLKNTNELDKAVNSYNSYRLKQIYNSLPISECDQCSNRRIGEAYIRENDKNPISQVLHDGYAINFDDLKNTQWEEDCNYTINLNKAKFGDVALDKDALNEWCKEWRTNDE